MSKSQFLKEIGFFYVFSVTRLDHIIGLPLMGYVKVGAFFLILGALLALTEFIYRCITLNKKEG